MVAFLTFLTLCCFALNSILSRIALSNGSVDPLQFALIRAVSAAIFLILLILVRERKFSLSKTHLPNALALSLYLICFTVAYVNLTTGVGALILFGCVQLTMLGRSLQTGEKFGLQKIVGTLLAISGIGYLVWPGVETPNLFYAFLMAAAGFGWGCYSILGKKSKAPTLETANHFVKASLICFVAVLLRQHFFEIKSQGLILAILSGAIASGVGYSMWYHVLPKLRTITASLLQLLVPIIAATGGAILLQEPVSARLAISALLTLAGVALALLAH